jgi:hypothetical protein
MKVKLFSANKSPARISRAFYFYNTVNSNTTLQTLRFFNQNGMSSSKLSMLLLAAGATFAAGALARAAGAEAD